MSYESLYEDTSAYQADVVEMRNDAMASWEESYVSPEPISLISDNINVLLQEDSDYMVTAKAASSARAEEAGYLESGFWEGAGEAAAIDKVLGIASGDSEVDLYNTFVSSTLDTNRYSAAYDAHLAGQDAQSGMVEDKNYNFLQQEFRDEQFGYIQERIGERQQDALELQSTRHAYDMEYQDYMQNYQLEQQEIAFDNHLALKEALEGYNTNLREQKFGYVLEDLDRGFQMDLDSQYRGQAFEQYNTAKNISLYETLQYNASYREIIASNLTAQAKEDAIYELHKEFSSRQRDIGTWQQIGDNPYSYEDFLTEISAPPERGSDAYKTGAWFGGGMTPTSFLDTLDMAFRDELSTKDRHKYEPAVQAAWIKENWDDYLVEYPEEGAAITKWFTNVSQGEYLREEETAYISVLNHWYDMMNYLALPEGEFATGTQQSSTDQDIGTNSYYSDYEIDDNGDILLVYYKPVNYYCDEYGKNCTSDQPDGRQVPSYTKFEPTPGYNMTTAG